MEFSYDNYIKASPDERLNLFMSTLAITNRTPEYYINWEKVIRGTKKFELELNTLNYLIGKSDIYNESFNLFTKQPELIKTIPSLIASRDIVLDILSLDENYNMEFQQLDLKNINTENIKKYVDFCEDSGLLSFLKNNANRSLVDYVYGIEAGLDSNGRKNRSGTIMESILSKNVDKLCAQLDLEHKSQATASYIKKKWGITVPVDKSERRFDEVIYDYRSNNIWIIETNYYGGGGSKLKSVSGEFINLNNFINKSEQNIFFIWITDGKGWNTAKKPLSEAFEQIDYIFNLEMLKEDFLVNLFNIKKTNYKK